MKILMVACAFSIFAPQPARAAEGPVLFSGKCFIDDNSKPIEDTSIASITVELKHGEFAKVGEYQGLGFNVTVADTTYESSARPRRQLTLIVNDLKKKTTPVTSIYAYSVEAPLMAIITLPKEVVFRCFANE